MGALQYVCLSTFFALGLHPLRGRWLQEHYDLMGIPQETYSYYGPLNWVMPNIGFHNEHHDFPMVAWRRLPQLSRLAPDFYQPLWAHQCPIHASCCTLFSTRTSAPLVVGCAMTPRNTRDLCAHRGSVGGRRVEKQEKRSHGRDGDCWNEFLDMVAGRRVVIFNDT